MQIKAALKQALSLGVVPDSKKTPVAIESMQPKVGNRQKRGKNRILK